MGFEVRGYEVDWLASACWQTLVQLQTLAATVATTHIAQQASPLPTLHSPINQTD
jgi:hypothetical protein